MKIELSVHPDVLLDQEQLRDAVFRKGRTREPFVVRRRSIDARRGKVRVHLVVEVGARPEALPEPVDLPALTGAPQVAIVGAGPAGMFCAWGLARRGIRSVILERGKPVRPRRHDLARLTRHGELDPDSNYCFGEGGAGTFSDGKLYTRSTKRGDASLVLDALVAYGAPPQIRVDARPHIGTNKLPGVVERMREHLESAGVIFRFGARVVDLAGTGVRLVDGTVVDAAATVLATGHSARDVLRFVAAAGASVRFKPFAVGVRVEHPQAVIDRIQFGSLAGHPALGAAAYRIVEGDAYSFCMCPGGFIAPAATEPDGVVVNGWSPSARTGRFANSGFVVGVGEVHVPSGDPFAGLDLQRTLERRAFDAGGGAFVAPAQRLDDLVAGRESRDLPRCSYPRGLRPADLAAVLGPFVAPLRESLQRVEAKLPGFVTAEAVAVGVESRTSCPVRIDRDPDTARSPTLAHLYPCGEGAGLAGGIMSAALDGLHVASKIPA